MLRNLYSPLVEDISRDDETLYSVVEEFEK